MNTAIKSFRPMSLVAHSAMRNSISHARPEPFTFPLVHQTRAHSFLNDTASQHSSRKRHVKGKQSWLWRRRRDRSAGSKISTLAVVEHQQALSQPDELDSENNGRSSGNKQEHERSKERQNNVLNPRTRRLLFWATVCTMPIWGRDVIEVVIPGMLGIFILVAGKVKYSIQWIHSGFSEPKR